MNYTVIEFLEVGALSVFILITLYCFKHHLWQFIDFYAVCDIYTTVFNNWSKTKNIWVGPINT